MPDLPDWPGGVAALVTDSSADPNSPIVAAAGTRRRALRDVYSVKDWGVVCDGVTNDTAKLQIAVNAVNAAGGGVLVIPPGGNILTGTITPQSNVTLYGYGAKITSDGTPTSGLFFAAAGTLTNFKLLGLTFVPAGNETAATAVFIVSTPAVCRDVEVSDCSVTGWAGGPFYFGNALRARALRNTILNCCTATGTNAINFVAQIDQQATQEFIAIGNIIEGCSTHAIAYVNTGNLHAGECRVIVQGNYCSGAAATSVGGGGIDLEFATASIGEGSKFVISGNICSYTGASAAGTYAISVNGASGNDGQMINRVVVSGNVVDSTAGGIKLIASQATVTGNVVNSGINCGLILGKQAANPASYVTVTGNIFHASNTISDNAVVWVNQLQDSKIHGNLIIVDAAPASPNSCGIGVSGQTATRLEISDNTVIGAPKHGILVGGADVDVRNNKVYNPSSQAAGFHGIFLNTLTGNIASVTGNKILDDRGGGAQMANGIQASVSATAEIRDNLILGYTNVPINGAVGVKRGNRYSTGAVNGIATLVGGTLVVNTTEVVTGDQILLTPLNGGANQGWVRVSAIVNKTSFTILSSSGTDTSPVYWEIRH